MAINLSRNTRLWVSTVNTGHDNSNTFEIPVQEGYSLSQSVSTADVTVEEAGPTPVRGSKRFNASLDPVEWSIATYLTPYVDVDTNTYLVDMLLWQGLASSKAPDFENDTVIYGDTSGFNVGFTDNSAHILTELYLYFKVDNEVYLVEKAQVGQAEISIDISDICMVNWSGNGTEYKRITEPAFMLANGMSYDIDAPTSDEFVKVPSNKKYIVNKLTTMEVQSNVTGSNLFYDIPLTSGSITINNNVTYLTPNTLSEVDVPIGSFTGSFEVSGTLEAYMRSNTKDGITAPNAKGTTNLLEDMLSNLNTITNVTNIQMNIGGKTPGTQVAIINIPTAHIAVPDMSVDDVISTSIEFKAIPQNDDLLSGTELTLQVKTAQ